MKSEKVSPVISHKSYDNLQDFGVNESVDHILNEIKSQNKNDSSKSSIGQTTEDGWVQEFNLIDGLRKCVKFQVKTLLESGSMFDKQVAEFIAKQINNLRSNNSRNALVFTYELFDRLDKDLIAQNSQTIDHFLEKVFGNILRKITYEKSFLAKLAKQTAQKIVEKIQDQTVMQELISFLSHKNIVMVDFMLDLILDSVNSSLNIKKLVDSSSSKISLIQSMVSLVDNKGSLGKKACKILKSVQTQLDNENNTQDGQSTVTSFQRLLEQFAFNELHKDDLKKTVSRSLNQSKSLKQADLVKISQRVQSLLAQINGQQNKLLASKGAQKPTSTDFRGFLQQQKKEVGLMKQGDSCDFIQNSIRPGLQENIFSQAKALAPISKSKYL